MYRRSRRYSVYSISLHLFSEGSDEAIAQRLMDDDAPGCTNGILNLLTKLRILHGIQPNGCRNFRYLKLSVLYNSGHSLLKDGKFLLMLVTLIVRNCLERPSREN